MIEITISVEEDVYDKSLKSTITKGSEETFVLPDEYRNSDKIGLIRDVKQFLEKAITQHDALEEKRGGGDMNDIGYNNRKNNDTQNG